MDVFRNDDMVFDVRDRGPAGGDPVVLLHGFPGGASTWDAVVPRLNEAGLRTLAPEQRGYSRGARPRRRRDYVVSGLVADTVALLDAAGVETAHVVGHDWGGVVAWFLAAEHPGRIRTLNVLSTPHPRAFARSLGSSAQGLRSSYAAMWQAPWLPEMSMLAFDGRALREALAASDLPEPFLSEYVDAMREPGRLTAALNWYRALPFDLRAGRTVGSIAVPTMYVWSSGDPALGRRAAELTERYVEGPYRFEVLHGAPHWLPEARPTEVVDLLLGHIRG